MRELDIRGGTCPLPILKVVRMLKEMSAGELLRVVLSDSESAKDMPSASQRRGGEIVSSDRHDDEWTFVIRKG